MPVTLRSDTLLTEDTLFMGRLHCRQPRDGYRFSVDTVLAAHFTVPKAGQRILDLGCGCGVIGLILLHRYPEIAVSGLEVQPELAELAEANSVRNGLTHRFGVITGDLREIGRLLPPESFDLVVSNPPYRSQGSGRLNLHNQSALARHELLGSIGEFMRAAAFAVKNRGRVVVVYPAQRCATLLASLQAERLRPKRLQPVYSYPGADSARLVLVEAIKNGGEQMELLAPFYLYERKNGGYSSPMRVLYEEEPCSPR